MAALRGPRLQAGSAAWIAEERSAALNIAQQEVEEFSYSARNELDWLNEHMAGIFDENLINFAETFKTPGKLRGKTPRTIGKSRLSGGRAPLSDVFATTPNGATRRSPQKNAHVLSARRQSRVSKASPSPMKNLSPKRRVPSPKPVAQPSTQDSGYYGSQDFGAVLNDDFAGSEDTQEEDMDLVAVDATTTLPSRNSPTKTLAMQSPEKTFQTAREEQTTRVLQVSATTEKIKPAENITEVHEVEPELQETRPPVDPISPSPAPLSSPVREISIVENNAPTVQPQAEENETPSDDIRSASDGSSPIPIRPVVRKSSLNFASLPAREPLVGGKSIGARVSRTSHLDHHRTSYYNRPAESKNAPSSGAAGSDHRDETSDHDDDDEDMGEASAPNSDKASEERESIAAHHGKTYTQRLQDQISMLGKSQSTNVRQSKSIPSLVAQPPATTPMAKPSSPARKNTTTTPGAFPEDEDDDWIEPPAAASSPKETRPPFPKSNSADIMEKIHSKSTVGEEIMAAHLSRVEPAIDVVASPARAQNTTRNRRSSSSSAASLLARVDSMPGIPLTKAKTLSNLDMTSAMALADGDVSPKSPSRTSPLKQVKNKLSSILKSSKGLMANSAALSAEARAAISPSPTRLGFFSGHSLESVASKFTLESPRPRTAGQQSEQPTSPTRPISRRTRASIEREKEEKRREKEAKHIAEQTEKLEKAREKEREKARVFSKEQDRTARPEAQAAPPSRKGEQDAPAAPKETPKPTRTSPRKTKAATENASAAVDMEVEVPEAPSTMAPPSVSRSAGLTQASRLKETKRPVKPTRDTYAKPKQQPTLIRVNTGSQHSQMNPSTSGLAANAGATPSQAASKASKASLQQKPVSRDLLKSSVSSSTGRPRALELAAKKKEQDDREAQRRRENKADMERKRAAAQEEQRRQEQQQRKQEAEAAQKQRERQAAIEKAKQTRAPPPAVRSQLNASQDGSSGRVSTLASYKTESGQVPRPASRMTSNINRPYEDSNRPVAAVLSNAGKPLSKRPLGADGEDGLAKRPPSRGGPSYQTADAKRRRTSAEFEDELEMSYASKPPVRPSAGFKKEMTSNSVFKSGYSNAPPSTTPNLFKATVTAQHHSNHVKAAHPLDMAQISKGAIPFAPNPNAPGPTFKTPARPGAYNAVKSAAKSVQRSSPRFQNGESIELPEIQTDEEDEDEEEAAQNMGVASWADSPDLRRALMLQETMDPSAVFGPPAPLNMEEVFNKSKDRFHKFRMRTSSANWSGTDRLTEDDIRKDMAARDKMRREGGWSYEMSKDML
jgi:hypothetical protein